LDKPISAPQILKTAKGENLAVLTERDNFALLSRPGDEDVEDRMMVVTGTSM